MEKKRTFIGWLKYLKRKNAKVKNFVKPDVSSNEAIQIKNNKESEVAVCPKCKSDKIKVQGKINICMSCFWGW